MKIRSIVLTLLGVSLVLQIAGCGQKGPLRLPGPSSPATSSPVSPAPTTTFPRIATP